MEKNKVDIAYKLVCEEVKQSSLIHDAMHMVTSNYEKVVDQMLQSLSLTRDEIRIERNCEPGCSTLFIDDVYMLMIEGSELRKSEWKHIGVIIVKNEIDSNDFSVKYSVSFIPNEINVDGK